MYRITDREQENIRDFEAYLDKVENTVIMIGNEEKKMFVKPMEKSRYFQEGRKYMRRRINSSYNHNKVVHGVFLTLTYNPSLCSREYAWENLGKELSRFFDAVNIARKRRFLTKGRLGYLWVVEEQKGTGYPHVHVFFPGLKWLWGSDDIARMWGNGFINVKGSGSCDMTGYLIKYIVKLDGWSKLGLSYLWKYGRRLYGISKRYRKEIEKRLSDYKMLAININGKVLVPVYGEFGKIEWIKVPAWYWDDMLVDMEGGVNNDIGSKGKECHNRVQEVQYRQTHIWDVLHE